MHLGLSPSRKLNQNDQYVVSDGYNDGVMRSGSQKQNKNSGGKVVQEFTLRNDNGNNNNDIRRQTAPQENLLGFQAKKY